MQQLLNSAVLNPDGKISQDTRGTGQGKVGKIADAAVVLLVRLGMQIGQERFLTLSKIDGTTRHGGWINAR